MKNRQKSRSGCRTCKLRRLRCDETKPGCRNCAQKGFECPGYQQRLQWSTKHERPVSATTGGPANFTQLVTAASESIIVANPTAPTANSAVTSSGPSSATSSTTVSASASPAAPPPAPAEPSLIPLDVTAAQGTLPGLCGDSPVPSSAVSLRQPSPLASPLTSPSQSEADVVNEGEKVLVPAARQCTVMSPVGWGKAALNQYQQSSELPLLQPVVDMPTFLIEHWFKSVCSSWSAYDSQANPYRKLTSRLWNSSMPVYYALQAISAASLVERLPAVMRDTALTAPRRAAEAIRGEVIAYANGFRTKFPSELLLSLFCMSSSLCWLESRQLGQHYVRQARAVLKSIDPSVLDVEDQELLEFFNGCLIYEEMLRSVVSDEDIDFEHMLSWPEPESQGPLVPAKPHAWTGVSADVLRLFGKAVALCRRSRTRWRHNDGTSYHILQGAMKDIDEATAIEESLLAIDVPERVNRDLDPRQANRMDHLHLATEAYRLSSLLQLYETFPDLITKRLPVLEEADRSVVWNTWVSPLALHIVEVLRKLPAGSLSCIQPLLCLCAGSGLRYDAKVPLGQGHRSYLVSAEVTVPGSLSPVQTTPAATATPLTEADLLFLNPAITETAIKTSRARQFLMTRLDELELSLPPKPIGVAKKLLRAVWSAYDEEIDLPRRTHWLDVMSHTGLHSLFG